MEEPPRRKCRGSRKLKKRRGKGSRISKGKAKEPRATVEENEEVGPELGQILRNTQKGHLRRMTDLVGDHETGPKAAATAKPKAKATPKAKARSSVPAPKGKAKAKAKATAVTPRLGTGSDGDGVELYPRDEWVEEGTLVSREGTANARTRARLQSCILTNDKGEKTVHYYDVADEACASKTPDTQNESFNLCGKLFQVQ